MTVIGFRGGIHWLVAAAMVLLLIPGIIYYDAQRDLIENEVSQNLESIARLKADQIEAWREDQLFDASLFQDHPYLVERALEFYVSGDSASLSELIVSFRSISAQHGYADMLLADSSGRVLAALYEGVAHEEGVAEGTASALETGMPVITPIYRETGGERLFLSTVAPLYMGDVFAGVLIAVEDTEEFLFPLIESWPVPARTPETLLIRERNGKALFLNDIRHMEGAALVLEIPSGRDDVPAVMAINGITGFVHGNDYRGSQVVAHIEPVSGSPWIIVSKMDSDEAFAVWRKQSSFILLILGGVILLGCLAVLLFRQRERKLHFRDKYLAEVALREALERHSVTLKAIGDGVVSTDSRGCVEIMNPVAERLTGWNAAEAAGKPLEEVFRIVNEDTGEKVENPVDKVLREGVVVGLANHTLLVAKDGSTVPIADSGAPITGSDGELSGVVLVFRDQTSERAAERAILSGEQRLRFALESNGLGSWEIDPSSGQVHRSPLHDRIFGYQDPLPSWTEQDFLRHIHPDDRQAVSNSWSSSLKSRCDIDIQCRILRTDGEERWIWIAGRHLQGSGEGDRTIAGVIRDITIQMNSENALRESEERFRAFAEAAPMGIVISDDGENTLFVSRRFTEMFGYTREEIPCVDRWWTLAYPDPELRTKARLHWKECMADATASGVAVGPIIFPAACSDGSVKHVEIRLACERGLNFITFNDVSRRIEAEAERENLRGQLLQAQKMESVGRLAGGVAHDFNNMLSVIQGYTEMALESSPDDGSVRSDLQQVMKAAKRSADIAGQLLAFARKQTMNPVVLNLEEEISSTMAMLDRLIGEDISLEFISSGETLRVKMDPSQLHQILANLCINARDAISGTGRISIAASSVVFNKDYCLNRLEFVPGSYAMFSVSDDGCGMNRETLENIFEPFFTTKDTGSGTGLGLAMVYGIVRQNDGFINVYSEPGEGTVFNIYIPLYSGDEDKRRPSEPGESAEGRGETILVVEDEPSIMEVTGRILEMSGYSVHTAGGPEEAISCVQELSGVVDLLVTDVVMPDMNGRQLAEELLRRYPDMRILYMSGYTANAIAHRGVLDNGVNFVQKPFLRSTLTAAVRKALDSPRVV